MTMCDEYMHCSFPREARERRADRMQPNTPPAAETYTDYEDDTGDLHVMTVHARSANVDVHMRVRCDMSPAGFDKDRFGYRDIGDTRLFQKVQDLVMEAMAPWNAEKNAIVVELKCDSTTILPPPQVRKTREGV